MKPTKLIMKVWLDLPNAAHTAKVMHCKYQSLFSSSIWHSDG